MREFTFPSSSSSDTYHTRINDNGLLSCDCPGWIRKKLDKVRECKHTKKVQEDEGLTLEERDGQMFVVSGAASTEGVQSSPSPAHGDRIAAPPTSIQRQESAPKVKEINGANANARAGFVTPMLASVMPEGKTADSFNADWIMEEKFDGHRIIVRVTDDNPTAPICAWSRLGNVRTLPRHIHDLMSQMPVGVYDGELLVPGMHSYDVVAGQNSGKEVLVLFDMLETHGSSLMATEQHVRRAFLEIAYSAITDGQTWLRLAHQFKPSMAAVQDIWDGGGEGAVIKKLSAKYTPGWRSPDWIKVKMVNHAVLTIIGFVNGKNGPYSIVQLRDDDGIVTTVKTLDNKTMREFNNARDNYIGKRLVISYHEKMPGGTYRHPMWDHLAGDGE